jgi:hypothetical protein
MVTTTAAFLSVSSLTNRLNFVARARTQTHARVGLGFAQLTACIHYDDSSTDHYYYCDYANTLQIVYLK